MAGGLTAYSTNSEEFAPREVDETRPSAKVIHIDGETGQVGVEKPDGSLVIMAPGDSGQTKDRDESFDANLAEEDGVPLNTIASRLLEGIEADIKSRAEWEDTANRGRELLGVKLEEASSEFSSEGMISQVKHLGLLEAVLQAWANSRAELLPADGPVKVADDTPIIDMPQTPPPVPGQPPPPDAPKRSELADALEKDFNHYLTVKDKEYVPDFSRMLLNRALNGVQFRKVFRCPLRRRPVSTWVRGDNLIVSNDASHLMGAGRVTERMKMRQSVVQRMMSEKVGQWRKVGLVQPTQTATPTERTIGMIEGVQVVPQLPADHMHEIYECYCELDDGVLAEDENGDAVGFPLPYRVTLDKESQTVLEIRRNWKEGDEDFQARRRYVKYGFVPGLGFYDWGLVHILGNPQRAATAIERMLIDAGMYKTMPGGLMAKGPGTRQRSNEIRPGPGQFAVIDTGGLKIQDVAMALPYGEPSPTLQAMGTQIATDMRRIGGVLNMPVGEGRVGNVPVGTMLAYVDSIQKVPSAIHKDDHAAQQEEFELLKELFMEEPKALTAGIKRPARAAGYTTAELNDQELVPKADPNVPSQVHRFMQTSALVEAGSSPFFAGISNPRGIWKRVCTVLGIQDISEVTTPPQAAAQPAPDPKIVAAQINAQSKQTEAQADLAKTESNNQAKTAIAAGEAINDAATIQSDEKRASMALAGKVVEAHAKTAQHAVSEGLDHVQHTQKLAQADTHHVEDLAAAQQPPIVQPDLPPQEGV